LIVADDNPGITSALDASVFEANVPELAPTSKSAAPEGFLTEVGSV
jgi:hypothetical protein